jgi:hypothetical protein
MGRNNAVVISLTGVLAYTEGVAFRVHVVARSHGDAPGPWMRVVEPPRRRLGLFRRPRQEHLPRPARSDNGSLAVEYRDGTRAECILGGRDPMSRPTSRPPSPFLTSMGGSGGGSQNWWVMKHEFWLWPLPPPEPIGLVVAWPALGLEPGRRELDGAAIVAAAARAEVAWPAG